jgi:cell wall-associated NlpC family hydrolase
MVRLPHPCRRLPAWTVLAATIGAMALSVSPAGAATAQELQSARDRIDNTSAQLAKARTAAEGLGFDERGDLRRLEHRLQVQKEALIRLESGLAARHVEETAAADTADAATADQTLVAPDASTTGDAGPVIQLSDPPAQATADATVVAAPGTVHADERSPAVTGDSAVLATQIDGYLASKASPLTGLGAVFVTEGEAVGLDPRMIVAIAGSETSFGTYGPSQTIHNPFGMGPHIVYASWSDAIRAAAQNLGGPLYRGSGLLTIPAIQGRWAPHGATNDPTNLNSNWTRNVGIYYAELGGDPLGAVFTGDVVAAAAAAPVASAAVPVTTVVRTPTPVIGQSGKGADAAQEILGELGAPSVARGESPEAGFDASGLVRWAFAQHQVNLPRAADAQSRVGVAVKAAELQVGDAIFFSDPDGSIVHEGVYVGGGQFVHAPAGGGVVTTASLYAPEYAQAYAGARRY